MAATGRIRLVFLALVITHLAFSSAWKLVLVHSNDILFQLDEIKGDNSDCFKPLPITTPTPTTSTLTTPTPTTPTPTTPTPTTPTPTTPTPTTSTPTDEPTDPSETSNAFEFRSEWEDQIFPDAPSEVSSDQQNVANDAFSSLEDFDPVLSKRVVRTASTRPSVVPSFAVKPKSSTPTFLTPYHADKVNSTVPFHATALNSSIPYHADPVNSSVPYHGDLVNSFIPYHSDKVNSSIPHHADVVNSTIPYHANVVNSTIPHHADVVNSTIPHHADVVNSTIPYHSHKVNSTIYYHADIVNSTVPYFADAINSFVPDHWEQMNSSVPSLHNLTTAPPFYVASTSEFPGKGDVECYGGVARHLTAKNELKNKSENFLYLNAGGMLGGNIWYPILGPAPASEVFSILGYDAVALGHRDFDEGVGVTIEYLRALKNKNVDVLCANIDASEQPEFQALIKKSKVVNLNGNKVGIVGFIGTDAEVIADTGKIKFLDEIESINKEVSSLFEEGVAFIVALGSSDHKKAQNMLEKLFDVDILVSGGGPDVFYYTGNQGPLGEKVTGNYPVVFSNQSKRLFVQTSRYGKYLGVLNVDITEGRIDAFNGNPSLLNSSYTPDANLQEKVDSWEYEVRKQSEEVIGSTKVPLVTGRHVCWYGECAGGNLIADAVRWYLELNETNWRDSISAAVWHGGAMVHTILSETTGSIKFGDILQMFPFANTLSTVRMSGSDVKRLMELSVESYNDSSVKNLGEFLHVSGMRVEFNMSAPAGQRVSRLLIRNTNKAHADWSELDANERYKIGMPSFIARGGSRYSFLEGLDHVDTKIRDEEALKSYIKWTSPLSYGFEERIRLINSTVDPVECKSADIVGTVFLTIFLTLLVVGLFFAGYKFLYPKIRDRSGSVLSLVR